MSNSKNLNSEIATLFYDMADMLEMKNVRWKPQAYRMGAQTLESLKRSVSQIYKTEGEEGIDRLSGIGEGLTKKIIEYIKTKKIKKHEELKKSMPGNLYQIMKVPGIGAKRALLFYKKLGIKNINDLKAAAKLGRLISLPGFKEKSQENILQSIGLKKISGRIPLAQAQNVARSLLRRVRSIPEIRKVQIAGSLRRKKPTVHDIDIIIQTNYPQKVIGKIVKFDFVSKVLAKGPEKVSLVTKQGLQVDFRVFRKEEFGAGLLYFTGDKQHNIWLRKLAIKKGLKLNEYGLFDKKTGKKKQVRPKKKSMIS